MGSATNAKYASIDDFSAETGEIIDVTSIRGKQIQRWLNKAERMIREKVPQLDTWATDATYAATVNDVEVSAVERKASNPTGMRSQMVQIDDGNYQNSIDPARSTGEIVILDDEWARLLKISASTNAFSVTLQAEPDAFPLPNYPFGY